MITKKEISTINIPDVLDYYALDNRVTSAGNANFCCPFHGDTNPSCGMHVKTGLWKCFGCGLEGNLSQFVADMEGVEVKEAEELIRTRWIEKIPDITTLQSVVSSIINKKPEPKKIDPTFPNWIISKFTKNWDYMYGRGFKDEALEYFNVVYDPSTKFQGFPCYDLNGKLVGITGRNTQNAEPRYFPILRFSKSHFVYNLYRIDPSKPVIAVEGEINCIAMHQHGYPNTVALLGAGVSQNQIDLLKNSEIKELIIFFDSDKAGDHGAKKIIKDLWKYIAIKIVPDHEGDPASLDKKSVDSLIEQSDYFSIEL